MNEEALKLTLSSSPHAHSPNSTRSIMLDVCIALLPALIGAIVFFGARAMEFGYAFAGIILVSLPMIILFLCLQKYFIKGIAAGAVKG